MANIVVYGEKGAYKATNEENYKKAIQNAREIIKFDEFESPEGRHREMSAHGLTRQLTRKI